MPDIEGLPKSRDPYAPSRRPDLFEPGLSEPPEDLLDQPEDLSQDRPEDLSQDREEKEEPEPKLTPPPPLPEKPQWEVFSTANKKDMSFRRSDGFLLRFRKLGFISNKYIAQLWHGETVLDQGQIMVPQGIDPTEFIQKMADYMLDSKSSRFEQQGLPQQNRGLYAPEESEIEKEPKEPQINRKLKEPEEPKEGPIELDDESIELL